MQLYKNKTKCCGCTACENICPNDCIEMKEDNEGFLYPEIVKRDKCTECRLCIKVCPLKKTLNEVNPEVYACFNRDYDVRQNSSSGGIFTLLAEVILKENGLVYGAKFDEKFRVYHQGVDNVKDLKTLRGSKYVQSDLRLCFKEIRKYLQEGKKILFSGTPCEVAGLNSYLRKRYENLYTVDLACHGVPSPMIFEKYKEYLESKNKSQTKNINFRSKEDGWTNYKIKFSFSNGKVFSEYGYENLYMKGFIRNLYVRPSCTSCKFKCFKSGSDITLADFWGVENYFANLKDNKGISLIFINSDGGKVLYNRISSSIVFYETSIEDAVQYNPCIIEAVSRNKKSSKFYKEVNLDNFNFLVQKYTKDKKEGKMRYYIRAARNILKDKATNVL